MTVRLCAALLDNWQYVDGYAMGTGMGNLYEYPLDRLANFAWWMLIKDHEQKEVEKIKARLWQPPRGEVEIAPNSPWAPENEMKAFSAIKSQMGMKK